uniref:FA complementation group D2 n=1 Tax=Sander lucioperca TaxID=283035 RepID=A0A8D0CT53_SANLU
MAPCLKHCVYVGAHFSLLDILLLKFYSLLYIEAKKSRSNGRQTKEPAPAETNESVFSVFLREAGVTLKQGGTSNEIAVDQVVFQKRIQKQLQKSPRYPGVSIYEFTTGLESHIEDPELFRNCLLPCVPRLSDGDSCTCTVHLPQILNLLFFFMQTFIINTLLEKLPEFMFDGIPHTIINQLKWLDRVVDSKELAVKLMELVSVAAVEVQRDIITSLPEILEDSQHNDIARELNSLLQENTQLTVPILDALSSLNLSYSLLTEVRGAVMTTLAAVQLEDLPVVVKFILHSVSASDAYEVVCNLRKKLELEQCVLPPVLQASQSRMKSRGSAASSQDSVALMLDGIKSAVRFQKMISEAWLKVGNESVFKPPYLLVLFILHSTNANQSRRGAERVLKVKVRAGLIQDTLLQRTFRDYAQVMRGYFPSILALAQSLLRSPDPCVVPFGGHMYRHSFIAFDSYCQQEVVGSLVTHVCSGVGGEVDMALELLCGLVTEKPSEMALYAVFVKGILDYMDNLTPQQIRRLFHLLSRLAFGQQQQGCHIQDDMHIVIRKQLSSTVPKYKRIGIIGAVMIVGSMGAIRLFYSFLFYCLLQVTALLELVKSSSESSPEAAALYYDELANLVLSSALHPQVQVCLTQTLNIFPMLIILNVFLSVFCWGRRVSLLCLSPFFRLLRLCEEKQNQGDLDEIDGLLGCPLILTDMDVLEKTESLSKAEREFLCTLLFHTINWLREVINAFCRQKETEMKMKVMTRLQNITYLQTLLERALAGTPGYVPPVANFDGECTDVVLLSAAAPVNKAKKDGTGKKRKAPGRNSSETWGFIWIVVKSISMQFYNVYTTYINTQVFHLLLYSYMIEVQEEVLLGPAELVFLLEDMLRKLEFSLTAAPAKRPPFFKVQKKSIHVGFSHLQQKSSKDIASYCVQLLLCLFLLVYKKIALYVQEHQLMSSGPAPLTFMSDIKSFNSMKSCSCVFDRIKCIFTPFFALFRHSFEYLVNFGSTMPSLSTALCLSQLLSTVSEKGGNPAAYREQTASLAKRFLSQDWVTASGEKERGNKFNEALHTLLRIYLEHVDDVLKAVEEIAGEGITELLNASKDERSASWPTLNRQTFLVFYKVLMSELEKAIRKIPAGKVSDNSEAHLLTYLSSNLFPQVFDSRPVLIACLKYGRLFLESFLKLGMPLLDNSFKRHMEDVQSLLKTFQLSTRQLHHMCGHSKIHQDTSLTNHVPALKKCLEQFVYRVKAMLTLNNCQEAFWIGNLKNRNLKGEEILSQRSQGSDEEDDDDDDDDERRSSNVHHCLRTSQRMRYLPFPGIMSTSDTGVGLAPSKFVSI